jgi:acetylornithine deacetylase/succinyl-diaminopimelate desuccinylase-like protein
MPSSRFSRREFLHAGSFTLAGASLGAQQQGVPSRPRYRLTTSESFDAATIPSYSGSHDRVYRYIDQHVADHLVAIQRWLRQPSISAQNVGIAEMAQLLRGDLAGMGFQEAEVVPTGGHPGVWGFYDAGAPKTLLVYLMYDVQPVNPDDWRTPPFEANVVETEHGRVLMARGATNQKGPERAFFNALESIIATEGTLPVNLMVTAEGEEEIGSVHYHEIVDRFEDRLRTCAGAFFPFNAQNPTGSAQLALGVKGIVYFEAEATGGPHGGPKDAEIHGSYKAIVDAPVWRLVQALSTLTTPDGNTIVVPGYYDDVRPPTDEEQRLINGLLEGWGDEALRESLGVDRWIDGLSGADAILSYLYHPTLNIDGIWGGYIDEGAKTILPHMATAKVDSRLPPHVDPDEALGKIRAHLDRHGFEDIVIRKLEGYPAAQTSIEATLVQAAIGVFNKYGHTPVVWPRLAGSAPFYEFTDRLQLPMVFGGLGHGSGAHAPNEYMVIEPSNPRVAGLAEVEKGYVDLLYALATA